MKKSLFSNLLLLLAAVVWGLAFTSQKMAAEHIPPFSVNSARFLVGGLFLIPVIFLFDRLSANGRCLLRFRRKNPIDITRRELIAGVICGCILFLAAGLQQVSLTSDYVGPGKASFLTALYVCFVPVIGLFFRKVAPLNVWLSVAIAVCGAYLLTSGGIGGFNLTGYDVLLLCSAFCFAVHIVAIDHLVPHTDAIRVSMIQFLVAGLLGIIPALLADPHIAPIPTGADILAALPSIIFLGVVSGGVGYTAQMLGQKMSGTPTISSLIMSLESIVGLLGGVILLDERMTGYQFGGCAAILFAVVFSQLPLREWYRALKAKRSALSVAPSAEEISTEHAEDTPPEE